MIDNSYKLMLPMFVTQTIILDHTTADFNGTNMFIENVGRDRKIL